MVRFILDTNVFIQAEKGPYAKDIFPAFWDWLDQQMEAGTICSSYLVYQELTKGTDQLAEWAKDRADTAWFPTPSPEAQLVFGRISQFVVEQCEEAHANVFLSGADPWIISQAVEMQAVVVTQEKKVPPNSPKVKIPNVCEQFNVTYSNTVGLLRELSARFTL